MSVAVDAAGNIYIADTYNNRIRRISTGGTISTVAGTGAGCAVPTQPCGDGGTATFAQLSNPYSVAVNAGVLYIADTNAHRIRRVASGTISTVAGNGQQCASSPACGDGGAATTGLLNYPAVVVAPGGGDLFVADSRNELVRWLSGPSKSDAPPVPPVDPEPDPVPETPPALTPATPPATPPATTPPIKKPSSAAGPLIKCTGTTCRILAAAADTKTVAKLRKRARDAQRSGNRASVELRRSGKTYATGMGRTLADALTLMPTRAVKAGEYRMAIVVTTGAKQRRLNRIVKLK